jgi:hypothetical protein
VGAGGGAVPGAGPGGAGAVPVGGDAPVGHHAGPLVCVPPCGASALAAEIDHTRPVIEHGLTVPGNLGPSYFVL